jgi:hypothetical protein
MKIISNSSSRSPKQFFKDLLLVVDLSFGAGFSNPVFQGCIVSMGFLTFLVLHDYYYFNLFKNDFLS